MQNLNTNKLVRFYNGVDGLKTGYTGEAGYCLTATAKKNNMRVIAVVMGEPDSKVRNSEVSSMLDYAFSQYEVETLLSKNSILKREPIERSIKDYVEIVPIEDINVLNKKGSPKRSVTYDITLDNIKTPLKVGDIVGMLKVKEDNKTIMKINLTVNQNIDKANIFELYWKHLKGIIIGNIKI